jgi:hypothetical protein
METLVSVCLGLGLSAACGFRVFVPLLVMSAAERTGYLTVSGGFDWIGSTPALVAFSVATLLEIAAYYVPWVDNLLDSVAGPAAVVAGVLVTASTVTELSPLLRWSVAVIAGGGVAASVQTTTTFLRHLSSLATFGLGNPVLSTAEAVGAFLLAVLAVVMPVAAVLALLLGMSWVLRSWRRRRAGPATA